jgi:hypothetical protein
MPLERQQLILQDYQEMYRIPPDLVLALLAAVVAVMLVLGQLSQVLP